MSMAVDVVVVGAGHAGVEAALAAARMGKRVALVTLRSDAIGRMSCNPAIGGLGKGHLVREVDALGGQMGLCADATAIQFRRLNQRKGAAVRGTRVQSDRKRYSQAMARTVAAQDRLVVIEGEVAALKLQGQQVSGIELADGTGVDCRAVIITTGTFLSGALYVGEQRTPGGRIGEQAASALSSALLALGLRLGRLKTGTPCRLDKRSLDYDRMTIQPGDTPPPRLSAWSEFVGGKPPLPQLPCHITYTNERTHEIIRNNLHRSAMYSGAISGTGPRYCPAIEDKIVRFADRERHQIFVEPEGIDSALIYPNGISTSLPADVQEQLVHSISGFENAKLVTLGYAVEYDFADPRQLEPTLAVRDHRGLYFAGQLNGTTGYEEAAAQGLIAGINAVRWLDEQAPLILRRDQAYIGVMIDDLVNRGTEEPYRMFTSRAEYRLLLREDNAVERLTPIGRELGLIDDSRYALYSDRRQRAAALGTLLETTRVHGHQQLDEKLRALGTPAARRGITLAELLLRPQVALAHYREVGVLPPAEVDDSLIDEQVELAIKYAGYIDKQREQAERLARLEDQKIPQDLDYQALKGLSNEVREKLVRSRPLSLGQAARIPGVTPAAIAILSVQLRRQRAA
ncbi:MAG: tRNA uridine-5-carboxymethylaminomethyl(34) synthesis enzyme MnmG [Deltaproteobacteria bacterium]|nr:tRNA uridine-5-carboxymethylaminomethyl(34) synthesis enzyme MnmG [Deltaproteobacteria bacterium]